jgi:hypothetical protein
VVDAQLTQPLLRVFAQAVIWSVNAQMIVGRQIAVDEDWAVEPTAVVHGWVD